MVAALREKGYDYKYVLGAGGRLKPGTVLSSRMVDSVPLVKAGK